MGDPNSHVVAHYDGKTLTASIETKDETYVVEPMWRHLPRNPRVIQNITEHDPSDMVVYRQSDVNLMDQNPHGKNGFCHTKELMDEVRRKQVFSAINTRAKKGQILPFIFFLIQNVYRFKQRQRQLLKSLWFERLL